MRLLSLSLLGVTFLTSTALLEAYPTYLRRPGTLFPYGNQTVQGEPSPGAAESGGPNGMTNYNSGIFRFQVSASNAFPSSQTIDAVCMDANQWLFTNPSDASKGKLHFVETLSDYTKVLSSQDPPASLPNADPAQALRKKLLGQLFAAYWADAKTTATKSSAFQWAVWEIVRDNSSTGTNGSNPGDNVYNAAGPDLTLSSQWPNSNTNRVWINPADAVDTAVLGQANIYLNFLKNNPNAASTHLRVYSPVVLRAGKTPGSTNPADYERIVGQEVITIDPTPEPAYFALLGAGLAGIAYLRRRRAQA